MRLRELVREQAPLAPMSAGPAGDMNPDLMALDAPLGAAPPPQPTISKAELKHKQLHKKELLRKDMPAVTALAQIQHRVIKNKLDPRLNIDDVLSQLGNALRTDHFTADALRDLNDRNPAVKNVIKNIEPDAVVFKTTSNDNLGTNAPTQNPQQTVSAMASKALKRRQK